MTTIKSSGDFHYLFGCSKRGIKHKVIEVFCVVFWVVLSPKSMFRISEFV